MKPRCSEKYFNNGSYEKRECKVCGIEFFVHKISKGRVRANGLRSRSCKTCSSQCSRVNKKNRWKKKK